MNEDNFTNDFYPYKFYHDHLSKSMLDPFDCKDGYCPHCGSHQTSETTLGNFCNECGLKTPFWLTLAEDNEIETK